MKTRSTGLAAAQDAETTTLAWCWDIVRTDDFELNVTTLDRDFPFQGKLYRAYNGLAPKAIEQDDTGAVANTEADGLLSDEVTEDDIAQGLWDNAAVEVFEVDWKNFAFGKMILGRYNLGDIKVGRVMFNQELRGLTQRLQKQVGRYVTKTCPWNFGDSRCRIDLDPLTVTGAVTSATDLRSFGDTSRTEVDDYFGAGVVTWLTGLNAGASMEIYSFSGGNFVLHLQMYRNIQVGDTYSMTPGCRKRFQEDCRIKWSNGNNFGGFDLLPGNDKQLGLGGIEGTNLA